MDEKTEWFYILTLSIPERGGTAMVTISGTCFTYGSRIDREEVYGYVRGRAADQYSEMRDANVVFYSAEPNQI